MDRHTLAILGAGRSKDKVSTSGLIKHTTLDSGIKTQLMATAATIGLTVANTKETGRKTNCTARVFTLG